MKTSKVISRASSRRSNNTRYKSQSSFLLQVRYNMETVLIDFLVLLAGAGDTLIGAASAIAG